VIKIESNMLVLDSSFSKDDVKAINEFVEISKEQERQRILKIINDYKGKPDFWFDSLIHMIKS
jgi:hypothetical protein